PLIFGIPVLTMFGVLGSKEATLNASAGSLGVRVEFPTRLRYRQPDKIRIVVANRSAAAIDTIRVAIDESYLDAFSNIDATPTPSREFEIDLDHVAPNESRDVDIDVRAAEAWKHDGYLLVT